MKIRNLATRAVVLCSHRYVFTSYFVINILHYMTNLIKQIRKQSKFEILTTKSGNKPSTLMHSKL